MVEVIPAILTDNITDLETKLGSIDEAADLGANLHRVQIDVIDGEFTENKTVDPALLSSLETNLSLDFHLMVKEPVKWVEKCANAAADRIIGQIEMMSSQIDFVGKVQETGLYVGLAVDLETPISKLDPVVLTNVDVILLMAVKAGRGGQKFDPRVLDKIKELDKVRVRDATPFKICVDGGETEEVIDDTHFAGADEVVVGKRLFTGNLGENIERMQKAAHGR
ncbi:MAG: Ribulose-phosphate 3-epimerase [Candidatus Woesebacteria bacterium GW2011_GWB1_45_5]|uniref:Ribulose-phosphate 3-epimerase n=1 Tax=Candidatus Woesebacteria bacterium GW2011_GWB1_45_5 TaxID=1618581 RepID=A0A0G1MPB3_9BACT|nr:MAG: Ribulose-phosphate 3-epimerase [Candidatus Woesebacteria bacterium GW2011_GWB1_45_5]